MISMKSRLLACFVLALAGLLAPVASIFAASAPRVVTINAGDTMKFDVTSIEAKPGEEIKVVLNNTGSLPIEAMGHNWVLLKTGSDAAAFATAAQAAKASNYIPDAMKDQIVAKIDMLGPKKSADVTFKVPEKAGDYPFLCTFPAHFLVGMKGVITVK